MYRHFFKNLFDRLIGLVFSILTFPIVLLLLILIRLESKGNPIFKQMRVGRNAKTFPMFKLRSMYVHQASTGSHVTQDGDSRITAMGRLVRKTSLDELPQFWNLLLGHMSLIGPRPDVPAQESLYTPEQWKERLKVRPGITGLAQATIRSSGTHEQRLALDLEYVRKCSLFLDVKIVFLTVIVLFDRKKSN